MNISLIISRSILITRSLRRLRALDGAARAHALPPHRHPVGPHGRGRDARVGSLLVSALMVIPVAIAQLGARSFRSTMSIAMGLGSPDLHVWPVPDLFRRPLAGRLPLFTLIFTRMRTG